MNDHPIHESQGEGVKPAKDLIIVVNRKKFGEQDGVKRLMTGAEIAHLVDVPRELAVIKQVITGGTKEIGVDEKVHITGGEEFIVTRKHVDGGFGGSFS